ncbi:MAG: radical SAM protein [bacterium]|nr:radical SAM protein [bacterium]
MKSEQSDVALLSKEERWISPVHVFRFHGSAFGFLPRTGDLVAVSADAAVALEYVEEGLSRGDVAARLEHDWGAERAGPILDDLESLHGAGLLTPEVELVGPERQRDLETLLGHQPRNLMFFVTEACNLACTYCYEKNQGVHDGGRSLKQIDARRIIDKYFEGSPGRRGLTITFFGGEPLLNPQVIRDTVAYAKERAAETGQQVDFTMTSNLTLLTEDLAKFLAAERFHVMVSMDGDREGHDKHRIDKSGNGTYDTVVRNLKMLIGEMRAAGVRLPKIRATLSSENLDPIEADRHLRTLGTHLVEIGETHGTVHDIADYDVGEDGHEVSRSAVDVHVEAALAQLDEDPSVLPRLSAIVLKGLREVHQEVTRRETYESPRPSLCGVCRNMKAVTPGGDIYPCHRYVGMEAFKMGNVHGGGLEEEEVERYYDRIYEVYSDICAPCWLRHLCGGQCPWYLSDEAGELSTPDVKTCASMRAGHERRLGLYALLLSRFPEAFGKLVGTTAESIRGPEGAQVPAGADPSCGC